MIAHQDPGMYPPAEAAMRLLYQIRPRLAILVVVEVILIAVPTCHDVIATWCVHQWRQSETLCMGRSERGPSV